MRWDCVLSYCLLVIHLGFWLVNIPVWLELCYHLLLWHFWQFMASFCFWVFSCDLWCKTVLLLTGSYKQKRKIPVFKKSSCTCGCSLKFTIFWKPSFFQEEDVCVFGTILISAASPDIWCRKTPFKPNTQNLMSWKCGHVKLGEHWNLAAGSSWQQLAAAGYLQQAVSTAPQTRGRWLRDHRLHFFIRTLSALCNTNRRQSQVFTRTQKHCNLSALITG